MAAVFDCSCCAEAVINLQEYDILMSMFYIFINGKALCVSLKNCLLYQWYNEGHINCVSVVLHVLHKLPHYCQI